MRGSGDVGRVQRLRRSAYRGVRVASRRRRCSDRRRRARRAAGTAAGRPRRPRRGGRDGRPGHRDRRLVVGERRRRRRRRRRHQRHDDALRQRALAAARRHADGHVGRAPAPSVADRAAARRRARRPVRRRMLVARHDDRRQHVGRQRFLDACDRALIETGPFRRLHFVGRSSASAVTSGSRGALTRRSRPSCRASAGSRPTAAAR